MSRPNFVVYRCTNNWYFQDTGTLQITVLLTYRNLSFNTRVMIHMQYQAPLCIEIFCRATHWKWIISKEKTAFNNQWSFEWRSKMAVSLNDNALELWHHSFSHHWLGTGGSWGSIIFIYLLYKLSIPILVIRFKMNDKIHKT